MEQTVATLALCPAADKRNINKVNNGSTFVPADGWERIMLPLA
jgi:hypothetical protein